MRLPAKPVSSPARTGNFPPPLMRVLSGNVASKSSARSRSSPMFVRKKTSAIETQEPSSPKVTCMGQVRIRKHSKRRETATARICRWIPTDFFCNHFSGKIKWKGWTSFFSSETEVGGTTGKSEHDAEKDDRKKGVCSTPNNALILTRTRSAPYPSSSLAKIFHGSPLMAKNTEEEERRDLENTKNTKPKSHPGFVSDQKRRSCSQSEERNDFSGEGSISERMRKPEEGSSFRPLILTRSKSEPSRIAEKLNSESNSRKIGKFGCPDFLVANHEPTRD